MTINFKNQLLFCFAVSFAITLPACSLAPTSSSSTSPPPTITAAPTDENHSGMLEVGRHYNDPSGDMTVSFLDVVGFQASVNEESETLEVILQMRDLPSTALRGQVRNVFEYFWLVYVYLDPSKTYPDDMPGDYYLALNTDILEPPSPGTRGIRTPIPGTPVAVPINQLFENKNVYRSTTGVSISDLNAVADPDADTMRWIGRVPGIKSNARFSFNTVYYDGTMDKPGNVTSSELKSLSTPVPETAPPLPTASSPVANADNPLQLQPAGKVRAFPGPEHYAGDILTFSIQPTSGFDESVPISIALDDQEPRKAEGTFYWFNEVIVPWALDTTDLTGHHTLRFTTPNGDLDETYSFEVLPTDQRPANEMRAIWQVKQTDCCNFHYLSETAAARDIDFISEHFQQGADEFEAMMHAEIHSKMDIYLMDRMLGNGGFGGNGKLVICYTDRYYGPTFGGEGLETLARHEFSHAADISLEGVMDGLDFNYEGLAVFIAGGHYKPEPLAKRGAALFDLGYYAPAEEQFIPQHELSYLHAAVILTYIADTYGEGKVWEFLSADDIQDEQLLPLEDAIQSTFGISLSDFDQGFEAWLEMNDPGEQLDDLRLTIELQDARREYQDLYSPAPIFLLSEIDVSAVTRPEYLPVAMREARASTNIATELMIAKAQRAIIAGSYPEAEQLVQSIKEVLSTGDFEDPLAKEYLDIVLAAGKAGYEVVSLNIQNGYATAQVTREPPNTSVLVFRNVNGIWQIEP